MEGAMHERTPSARGPARGAALHLRIRESQWTLYRRVGVLRCFLLLRNQLLGIGKTRFDVINREPWVILEELSEIRVGSKLRKNKLHRNPRPLDNWLANQDIRVLDNALRRFVVFLGHGVLSSGGRPLLSLYVPHIFT